MVPQSYSSRKLTNLWKSLLNNFLVNLADKVYFKKITLDSIGIWNSLTIFTLIKTYSIVFGSKYWLFTLIITFFFSELFCLWKMLSVGTIVSQIVSPKTQDVHHLRRSCWFQKKEFTRLGHNANAQWASSWWSVARNGNYYFFFLFWGGGGLS